MADTKIEMNEYSKEELRKLRKALEVINSLNGILLPQPIVKTIVPFQNWLLKVDANSEEYGSLGDLFFGWVRKRKRKKLWEQYMQEKFTEMTILQLETTLKDSKLCLKKSKLELEFIKRELKRGKQNPSYVR